MCGILATIGDIKQNISQADFHAALKLQSHRGPNDIGFDEFHGNRLGHTRLSILDLSSAGHQPMYSECKGVALIFNGEIYNFKEIRAELESAGIVFNTQSDTEVLLKSYLHLGIDCIQQFIGMFAFIIVDKRVGVDCTYVVRDRLGIKPLFYLPKGNGYIFASEVKSILPLAKQKFNLNKKTVSSYFSYRYSILDETFFEGIKNLKPGSYLRITPSGTEQHQYWQLSNFVDQSEDKGEAYYLKRLDELLHSSIKYRMISDVPFGAYLSGGVDSSLVTAIMSKYSAQPIKTYTIGFSEQGYNEFEYADCVAKLYQTDHKAINIDATEYFDTLNKLVAYKDAPLSVPNEVPLYLMSQELKKEITVVLSGEGADEIFGGYGRIFRSTDDFINQDALKNQQETSALFEKKYGDQQFETDVEHFIYNYSYTKPALKQNLLAKNIDWHTIELALNQKFKQSFNEVSGADYQTKMMYTFETVHLQGLLSRVDTTTMATSVEARVPFVDHRLVEFAFSIPNKYKLKWNSSKDQVLGKNKLADQSSEIHDTPKYILKKVGEKYLPDDVLYRKKMGFPVPLDKWLGGSFADDARKILADKNNIANQVIDTSFVLSLLDDKNLAKNHSLAMKVWMVLNLFAFCSAYKSHLVST
ncbi:asparagine synthase (glutamine-hydrolyzing) [Colwellia sp. MB3u-70]|uniref:asparagine synthase (glutamine-hydrolyzing) n=1 Tax=unclassified Colwellia TaxID=196834 RepID=UPI0015F5F81E|nr:MULTISPECIES: asparagine synthase (glutamine-hydrolyzing) [unclassified Colwellia]MBA6294069.1 asparagine synthase (glutamine-hydrolyzing) [Colwellia sp. MB3u-8]MBA6307610.1 asparagine synthase (glutamine-hydrolyzing) [Colwellia sp. MB3u-70]